MISCDEEECRSDSDSEIEETQEVQWLDYEPNWTEKEEHLVCNLIDVSEKLTEEDKSVEYFIATGWEGAGQRGNILKRNPGIHNISVKLVQSWGRFSPFSCLQPQKNPKKLKSREDSSGCLLCSEMLKVTDKMTTENKTAPDPRLLDSKSNVLRMVSLKDNVQPPAEKIISRHCAPREHSGELQQTNELCPWYQEKSKSAGDIMFREFKDFYLDPEMPNFEYSNKDSLSLKTFMVLPPVKATVVNDRSFSAGRKSKGVWMQQQLKIPSQVSVDDHLYGNVAKTIEQKGEKGRNEKRNDFFTEQMRMHEPSHLIGPIIPRGPLLQEAERFYWQCSFIPGKNSATVNAIPSKHQDNLSNLGLLQAQGALNKRNMRLDDLRAPLAQHVKNGNEAKRRNRSKVVPAPLLAGPILPSLTVTRVQIPVSPYRLL